MTLVHSITLRSEIQQNGNGIPASVKSANWATNGILKENSQAQPG